MNLIFNGNWNVKVEVGKYDMQKIRINPLGISELILDFPRLGGGPMISVELVKAESGLLAAKADISRGTSGDKLFERLISGAETDLEEFVLEILDLPISYDDEHGWEVDQSEVSEETLDILYPEDC